MYAKEYSNKELMAYVCSRELKDHELVFVGIGIPMMGGLLAARTHAKNMVFIFEGGGVGAKFRRLPFTIVDNPCSENALTLPEMWRIFSDTQRGYIDTGLIGGAQIDKFGNLNTTVITSGGKTTYENPTVRLAGSGGANDIATSCRRTLIVMGLDKGKFVEKVDFITTPGWLSGPGAREAAGLRWGGPEAVITDKCLFRFDPASKEMYLDALYPGVSVEEVRELVPWDLNVSPSLKTLDPPLEEYIQVMRRLDPGSIILGKKSVDAVESFEDYCATMIAAYEAAPPVEL